MGMSVLPGFYHTQRKPVRLAGGPVLHSGRLLTDNCDQTPTVKPLPACKPYTPRERRASIRAITELRSRDRFDLQADRFDRRAGLPADAVGAVAEALLALASPAPGEIVLELGAGTGEIGAVLAARGRRYIGQGGDAVHEAAKGLAHVVDEGREALR